MAYQTHLQAKFSQPVGDPAPKFNTGHPIHPAIVHFPIAFLTFSYGLDVLYALTTTYVKPDLLTTRFGQPETLLDITRLGYLLLCAGLICTVPAIASGNIQLVGLIKKNGGPWEKDPETGKQKNTMVPRIKLAITHAITNDVIFLTGLYSWYIRRAAENEGHVPNTTNMKISMVLLPMLAMAANMGGRLTYNHGVGLNLGRKKVE